MFGDRTILQNIQRTPWMGKPSKDQNDWTFYDLPNHGKKNASSEEIAANLFRLLCAEIESYTKNSNRIGLLLSGGMDSRMVAGVLQHLINQGRLEVEKVIGFTWGNENSRDAVYAKRITDYFDWEWRHYTVAASDLWNNIIVAGERGCEYSGFHLHALPQIASQCSNVDVMLAGSYGDSVGRAEYSGRHVTNLLPIERNIKNPAFLLKKGVYRSAKSMTKRDINRYHSLHPRKEAYQQLEIDYQCHYMRRMLNPCMELINDKVPFRQAFTAPDVFGYMWSLDPTLRGNAPYKKLLNKLDPFLSELPWARTGKRYLESDDQPDHLSKKHHSYEEQVQSGLIDDVALQLSKHKSELSYIFNYHAIENLINLIKERKGFNFDYLENLLWLTSFTFFIEKYDIQLSDNCKSSFQDKVNSYISLPLEYNLKREGRKIKRKLLS